MGAMRHTPHGSFVNMWDANVEGGRAYLEAARQLILCKVRCTFKILSFTSFRRDDEKGRGVLCMGRLFYLLGLVLVRECLAVIVLHCHSYIAEPPLFVISIPTQEEEHILKLQGSLHYVKCVALSRSSPSLRSVGMTRLGGCSICGDCFGECVYVLGG